MLLGFPPSFLRDVWLNFLRSAGLRFVFETSAAPTFSEVIARSMKNTDIQFSSAFVDRFQISPYQQGALDNLTFAVKDNIDIAGYGTSNGSKRWLDSHTSAVSHAVCVEQVLNAGATCIGKAVTDELTCSLDGENPFYGTPLNPSAPERVPGGSSSGSASAVACGAVDFAIGTDSAGSTRVPASNCGVWGMRPTTHRISESGIIPFAPSSSTVGVFANELSVLEKVAKVLLSSEDTPQEAPKKLYLLEDAFSIADKEMSDVLRERISALLRNTGMVTSSITLDEITGEESSLRSWQEEIFSPIQCVEIWNAVGAWIDTEAPKLGPRVQDAMMYFRQFDRKELNAALCLREKMFNRISRFMKTGVLVCFPTTPTVAPRKGELDDLARCREYYGRTMGITSFSGVAALPEVTVPITRIDGAPVGVSFAAASRQDEFLLSALSKLSSALN